MSESQDALCLVLADIRAILGVNEKPMMSELPDILKRALIEASNEGYRDASNVASDYGDELVDDEEYMDAEDAAYAISARIEKLIQKV